MDVDRLLNLEVNRNQLHIAGTDIILLRHWLAFLFLKRRTGITDSDVDDFVSKVGTIINRFDISCHQQ